MAEEDEEGWRLVAAEEYGAAAQEEARRWLSAQALRKLQDETDKTEETSEIVQPSFAEKPNKRPKPGKGN